MDPKRYAEPLREVEAERDAYYQALARIAAVRTLREAKQIANAAMRGGHSE